jgi:uncharacterized CHY-type Zn-finger protein
MENKDYEELIICPDCRVPLTLKEGSFPYCVPCQTSWENEDHELPTERYFEGDDRRVAL